MSTAHCLSLRGQTSRTIIYLFWAARSWGGRSGQPLWACGALSMTDSTLRGPGRPPAAVRTFFKNGLSSHSKPFMRRQVTECTFCSLQLPRATRPDRLARHLLEQCLAPTEDAVEMARAQLKIPSAPNSAGSDSDTRGGGAATEGARDSPSEGGTDEEEGTHGAAATQAAATPDQVYCWEPGMGLLARYTKAASEAFEMVRAPLPAHTLDACEAYRRNPTGKLTRRQVRQ